MPRGRKKTQKVRLQEGDWAIVAYCGRLVCVSGPAQLIGHRPQILDRRFRWCYVEDYKVVFYGDEFAVRYVFDELEKMDTRHHQEEIILFDRQVQEIRNIVKDATNTLNLTYPHHRAETGPAQIYACSGWSYLTWTGLDPLDEMEIT